MIHLKTNVRNIITRIFLAMLFAGLTYSMITQIITGQKNHEKAVGILYFLVVCLLFILTACISSCFEIVDVTVDTLTGVLTLNRPMSKTVISRTDISGYYSTSYTTSFKEFKGLILKMNNTKSYRLREQNLKSIPILMDYLEDNKVKYLGNK